MIFEEGGIDLRSVPRREAKERESNEQEGVRFVRASAHALDEPGRPAAPAASRPVRPVRCPLCALSAEAPGLGGCRLWRGNPAPRGRQPTPAANCGPDAVNLARRMPGDPLQSADLVNPEDFDPRALAWVVLQACCLRGIVFSTGRARRLADVLRLAARAGRLRPAGEGAHPERDIWVDPLGGVYDLTHLEILCLPASAFGGPAPVPCAPTSGVG